MPTPVRRLARPLALALVAGALSTTSAPAAHAADPLPFERAAQWLAGSLSGAGTVLAAFPDDADPDLEVAFTDYGRTADAVLGLLAAEGDPTATGRALTSLTSPAGVGSYTQGKPFDRPDAAYAGATAKLAFVVEAAGGDATAVGGTDLLAQLASLVGADGRLADRSTFGNYANTFGQSFALLALDAAGRAVPSALVDALVAAQCANGAFPVSFPTAQATTCTGTVDATGLALQALAAVDRAATPAATRARDWLAGQQRTDGSFPGEVPVNSTGYAVIGLRSVGADTSAATAYLASQQNADGGLRRGTPDSPASDVFATAQALPALAGDTFAGPFRAVTATAVPCAVASVAPSPAAISSGGRAVLTLTATSGTTVELSGYSRPSTSMQVLRSVVIGRSGTTRVAVRPTTNSRYVARQVGCEAGASSVVEVAPALTLAARRNAPRDYTFNGTSAPPRAGGLVISLYRITADGRAVLAARTRADATTGKWLVRRVFSGSGRFGFVVRTGRDMSNAPGTSTVRPTVIH